MHYGRSKVDEQSRKRTKRAGGGSGLASYADGFARATNDESRSAGYLRLYCRLFFHDVREI